MADDMHGAPDKVSKLELDTETITDLTGPEADAVKGGYVRALAGGGATTPISNGCGSTITNQVTQCCYTCSGAGCTSQ